jgi:hypothetical protein
MERCVYFVCLSGLCVGGEICLIGVSVLGGWGGGS